MGLPSDLLKRRPDVRAAERRIAAANARIGIAQADLYPHFSLTGVAGLESLNFSSFGNASSGYYQIGPGITWRIFDAGKIRFQVRAESARTAAATAAYERSVLEAFRDVETALVSYANTKVRRNELAAESAADRSDRHRKTSLRARRRELPARARCGTFALCGGRCACPK